MANPDELVTAEDTGSPVVVSKKFIVSPAVAEDNWTERVAAWPDEILGGVADPLIKNELIDCGVVAGEIILGVVERQTIAVPAVLVAQLPETVKDTDFTEALRLFNLFPA